MIKTEEKIFSTFSSIATSLGYNEVHGRIIASLLVSDNEISLKEMSKITGYSLASLSISLDMLEIIGIIKKVKNPGDRKLYIKLDGDILEGLRSAFLMKVQKGIDNTMAEFEQYKKEKKHPKYIENIQKEVIRFNKYFKDLSEVKLPK